MDLTIDYPVIAPTPITFREKLTEALERQGRTKTWVADFLDISRQTLYNRLAENNFKTSEVDKLKSELGIR